MGLQIGGLDNLISALDGLPRELKKAEGKILREMCKPIQKDAINNVPRSKVGHEKHKHIKDNIIIGKMQYVNGIATRFVEVEYEKSEIFWDHFLEWGTSKMPPKPFMSKAYLNKRNEAVKIGEKHINKILKKVSN